MLDIVPSGDFDVSKGRSKRKSSQHVLKVDWKLPSRLTRPVHKELTKQKNKAGFTVEKIYKDRRVRGLESHTGDFAKKPSSLSLTTPPHRGGYAWGKRRGRGAVIRREPMTGMLGVPVLGAGRRGQRPKAMAKAAMKGERDLAYNWKQYDAVPVEEGEDLFATVQQPKKKFWMPWHFERRPMTGPWRRRVAAISVAMLVIGVLVVQGIGLYRLQGNADELEGATGRVMGQFDVAQEALAAGDYGTSVAAWNGAMEEIRIAQATLNEALGTQAEWVSWVDVTGAVRSGHQALEAGAELAAAGKAVTEALEQLEKVDPSDGSIILALEQARHNTAEAATNLEEAERRLSWVGSPLLPRSVKEKIKSIEDKLPPARETLERMSRGSDMALHLLGAEQKRHFLLLFQNNHELRPTGGFVGSLALVTVDQGAIENIDLTTVYDPDGQLADTIAPPEPLRAVTDRWFLRDANWFMDYSVSASKMADFFEREGGPTVDAVIAMTPDVTVELLRITGPIELPQYDVTVDADNIIAVTQEEVTYNYDKEENKPKQFMADLAPILMDRLLHLNREQRIELGAVMQRSLMQKNLLLLARDEDIQTELESLGWAGKIEATTPMVAGVNTANIGGHKSDQFVTQEVDARYDVLDDGEVEATVTIRRHHRGPIDGAHLARLGDENPALKDNVVWQRMVVPEGSVLLSAKGFTPKGAVPRPFEKEYQLDLVPDAEVVAWQRSQSEHESGTVVGQEAGHAYFANWLVTKPGETTIAVYTYRLPDKVAMPKLLRRQGEFDLTVFKQPGDNWTTARVEIRLPERLQFVASEPGTGITQVEPNVLVWRGAVTQDVRIGAVFEKQ